MQVVLHKLATDGEVITDHETSRNHVWLTGKSLEANVMKMSKYLKQIR